MADDLFADVSFPDAKISLDGGDAGGPAGDPGQDGNPPQPSNDSPEHEGKDGADPSKAEDGTKESAKDELADKSEPKEKPLPYDQDPKWKKARAAEKTLNEILEANDFLDPQDLLDTLEQGKALKEQLGESEVENLLAAQNELKELKAQLSKAENERRAENETPEEAYQRLEDENSQLRDVIKGIRDQEAERVASAKSIENYEKNVNRVLNSLENPLNDDMREMALMLLGVNNSAITTDIDDVPAVRQMVKDNLTVFNSFVQKIQQDAIDNYAAGKSKLKVSDPSSEKEPPVPAKERKPIDPKASVDEVFGQANEEFVELLNKGLKAMH